MAKLKSKKNWKFLRVNKEKIGGIESRCHSTPVQQIESHSTSFQSTLLLLKLFFLQI